MGDYEAAPENSEYWSRRKRQLHGVAQSAKEHLQQAAVAVRDAVSTHSRAAIGEAQRATVFAVGEAGQATEFATGTLTEQGQAAIGETVGGSYDDDEMPELVY